MESQQKNLVSAIAIAALVTGKQQVVTESELYEEIVQIPHYQNNYFLGLLDKEDDVGVVEDNFQAFQTMYHPIIKEYFADVINISSGNQKNSEEYILEIDRSKTAMKKIAMQINDNVYKNIDHFSV